MKNYLKWSSVDWRGMGPLGSESSGMKPWIDNDITAFFNSMFPWNPAMGMVETFFQYTGSNVQQHAVSGFSVSGSGGN